MTSDLHDPSSPAYRKAQRQYFKSTKNRDADVERDWTPFRAAEKRFKARFPPPDLSNVLDLATLDEGRGHEIQSGIWAGRPDAVAFQEITLKGGNTKGYILPSIPGLILLPSFVSRGKQRELIRWSLSDQAKNPNPTNLDIHYSLPGEGLWNQYLSSQNDAGSDPLVHPRSTESDASTSTLEPPGPRKLVNNSPASSQNFQTLYDTPKPEPVPSITAQPAPCSSLIRKLRWANIGWYYHWGTKQYDFARGKAEVDASLQEVCRSAVSLVDWEEIFGTSDLSAWEAGPEWRTWNESYEPDAGIVNFYQTKDTLMAHVDRSEICATSPLVSLSLGNAAIFLIGGLTRDTKPTPILLRSGDVVIMSGPACRRAYHGVPRILEDSIPPHLTKRSDEISDWGPYGDFMRTTRININVRQVFPKGFDPTKAT